MRAAGGARIGWDEVPPDVRRALEVALGSPVIDARNQPGGFSPGLAARCQLADGRRAFVKAVSPDQNVHSARIHRREAEVAAQLPGWVPAPELLHVHDDGNWVALVFEDVHGRQPREPWTTADLDLVLPAVRSFGAAASPAPVAVQSVVDKHRSIFDGWRRLAAGDGDVTAFPPWVGAHVEELAELESGWEDAACGDTLLHADLRADNILVRPDGSVLFVDWPWACHGAAFVDPLLMLPSIGLGGGPAPAEVIDRHELLEGVDESAFVSVFAAMCGFFVRSCLDPSPPGLPALRAFQRAQADVGLAWLRSVLDQGSV